MFSARSRIPHFLLAGALAATISSGAAESFASTSTMLVNIDTLLPILVVPPVALALAPQSATVVIQDTATWLVSEFTGNYGCVDPVFDSLNPSSGGRPGVLRVVWDYPLVKMDSASGAACAKVRRFRRVDRLPTLEVQTFGVPGPVRIPYSPDTVKFCRGGACVDIAVRKVRTPSTSANQCLDAVARPFDTRQQAIDFLKGKVATSRAALRLNRQIIYYAIDDIAARRAEARIDTPKADIAVSIGCVYPTWVIAPNGGWPDYLQPLASWNDPRVGASYALPSPGNANDMYGKEALKFYVDTVPMVANSKRPVVTGSQTLWSYPSGVEGYLYRGSTTNYGMCSGLPATTTTIFADTLATSGQNLLITNALPQCGRRDVDALAGTRNSWFALLPWTGEPLESVFRHYGSVETDWSWPMDGDSILVRGQKVAVSELQSTAGVVGRHGMAGFAVSVSGKTLSVDLPKASELRVMDAVGHVLTNRMLAQGRSLVSLPAGARGMLVVQANGIRRTVVVP